MSPKSYKVPFQYGPQSGFGDGGFGGRGGGRGWGGGGGDDDEWASVKMMSMLFAAIMTGMIVNTKCLRLAKREERNDETMLSRGRGRRGAMN